MFDTNGVHVGTGSLEILGGRGELTIEEPTLVEQLQKQHHSEGTGCGLVLRLRLPQGQFRLFSATGYIGPIFFGDLA